MRTAKCSDVRRELLRQDELTAFDRGLLDIHLRRCSACNRIAEEFITIERSAPELEEVTTERRHEIYSRLVPTVHELTSRVPPPPKPVSLHLDFALNNKKLLLFGSVVIFAMALAFVLSNLIAP